MTTQDDIALVREALGPCTPPYTEALDRIEASLTQPARLPVIEGLEEAIDVLEAHMQDMGEMAVVLIAAREYAALTEKAGG